ncbi:MAG TPA: hypothetical protein VGR73_03580 [Bryobacteraceae bacterium]|nr:hypothetical protein [Bryobacteraceae bacterium]
MIFPGFPAIQDRRSVSNPLARSTLSGSGDASFAEVALGLIGSAPPVVSAKAAGTAADSKASTRPVSAQLIATTAVNSARVDRRGARDSVSAAPSTTVASAAPANRSAAAAPNVTAPAALASPQSRSMFSCVLTPAQYLENVMAEIQSGAPTSSDAPMTVAEVLQQALANNYSTPENPYAECSDPAAAAALIARIAGPNANVMVPTVAGMTTAYTPATPAGWVGNYTIGYATQSSGFNDAGETFGG